MRGNIDTCLQAVKDQVHQEGYRSPSTTPDMALPSLWELFLKGVGNRARVDKHAYFNLRPQRYSSVSAPLVKSRNPHGPPASEAKSTQSPGNAQASGTNCRSSKLSRAWSTSPLHRLHLKSMDLSLWGGGWSEEAQNSLTPKPRKQRAPRVPEGHRASRRKLLKQPVGQD